MSTGRRTILSALLGLVLLAAAPASQPVTMVEPRVHDPSLVHAGDAYYVFGTGLSVLRSTDLVHWTRLGRAFKEMPAWVHEAIPTAGWAWAPHVSFFNGQYHLYYCVSTFGKNRSCIGLATNPTLDPASPEYRWTDHGKVLESQIGDGYNAIDPNLVMDADGVPWLTFGSFWGGIKLRKLDAATGMPDERDRTVYSLAARPRSVGSAVEGPSLIRRGDFYYLFVSFDLCCRGASSTYRTMVGRSTSITGPYVDKAGVEMMKGGGTQLLAGDAEGRVRGPGGGSVVQDGDRYLWAHHFYDANDRGISKLQVRPLTWTADGWPIAGEPLK